MWLICMLLVCLNKTWKLNKQNTLLEYRYTCLTLNSWSWQKKNANICDTFFFNLLVIFKKLYIKREKSCLDITFVLDFNMKLTVSLCLLLLPFCWSAYYEPSQCPNGKFFSFKFFFRLFWFLYLSEIVLCCFDSLICLI